MRNLEEIKATRNLNIVMENPQEGIMGYYYKIDYTKKGTPILGQKYTFVFSWHKGWEHLSISLTDNIHNCPTWDEMCMFKDMFFKEDEACVEYHPKKEDYVNVHPRLLTYMATIESRVANTR